VADDEMNCPHCLHEIEEPDCATLVTVNGRKQRILASVRLARRQRVGKSYYTREVLLVCIEEKKGNNILDTQNQTTNQERN